LFGPAADTTTTVAAAAEDELEPEAVVVVVAAEFEDRVGVSEMKQEVFVAREPQVAEALLLLPWLLLLLLPSVVETETVVEPISVTEDETVLILLLSV
jgi:hypothetical protein